MTTEAQDDKDLIRSIVKKFLKEFKAREKSNRAVAELIESKLADGIITDSEAIKIALRQKPVEGKTDEDQISEN